MAQENQIIIDVSVNSTEAEKRAKALTGTIAAQREELKAWRKVLKDSGGTNKEAAEEVAKLDRAIKKNNAELRRAQKETTAEANSINALRASINKLNAERNSLNTSTEEGAQRFRQLTAQLESQRDKLNEVSKAAGDYRANVGNYTNSIKEALGSTAIFGDVLGETAQGFDLVIKAASPLTVILGLIIGALSVFFSRSREGRQTLERLQAVIKATFGVLLDLISNSVKAIRDFVAESESIGDFFSRLGDVIIQNLKNRLDGLVNTFGILSDVIGNVISGDFDKAKKSADGLATSLAQFATGASKKGIEDFAKAVETAATQADNLAKANIRLRASIRANTVAASEAQREAERNRKARDDEFKSLEERLVLNKKVLEAEKQRTQAQLAINRARQQILTNEIALGGGLVNATEEQLNSLAELRAEAAEIEEDFLGRTTEQLTEANSIRREELQAQITLEKELLNTRILQENLAGKALLNAKLAILEKEKEAELVGIKEGSVEANAITQQFINARLELINKFNEDKAKAEKEATDKALEAQRQSANAEIELLKQTVARKKQIAQLEGEVIQQRIGFANSLLSFFEAAFGRETQLAKAAFVASKAIAIAEVAVNLQKQLSAIATKAFELTLSAPGPLGIAAGTAYASQAVPLANATAGLQIATIAAQTVAGFANGGYTGDGGTYTPAGTVHKGEFVVSKRRVQALGGASNVARLTGQPVRGYASGGAVGLAQTNRAIERQTMAGLSNDMRAMQVQVSVTDINKAQTRYSQIQSKVTQ